MENNNFLTTFREESISCPKCGKMHILPKYSMINVTEKPEYKEKLLKNQLFLFECEECGLKAPLTYDCIYIDRKKKLVIAMSLEEPAEWKSMIEELSKQNGYQKRIVDNINDMKEKILIADNLMDDRIVEMSKVMLLKQLENEMKDDVLQNVLFDYSGNEKFFVVFFEKKGVGRVPFTIDFYRGVEQNYQSKLKSHTTSDFLKVDMEWAGNQMFVRH